MVFSTMARKYLPDRELEDILSNDSDLKVSQVESLEESDDDIFEGQSEHMDHNSKSEEHISEEENENRIHELFQDETKNKNV